MVSELNDLNLIEGDLLDKMLLAQRVGKFLRSDKEEKERLVIENVAHLLAKDLHNAVREMLAFEIRNCTLLNAELAETIATDIQSVSKPFLAETPTFTDDQLATLIPKLQNFAHVTLAKRKDIGEETVMALVTVADSEAVTFVVRNHDVSIPEKGMLTVMDRFPDQTTLMDYMSERTDLPVSIALDLIERISAVYKNALIQRYNVSEPVAEIVRKKSTAEVILDRLNKLEDGRVHGYVIDLHREGKISIDLILELGPNLSHQFLLSSIAVLTGNTVSEIRVILSLEDTKDFVRFCKGSGFTDHQSVKLLRLIKQVNESLS
ncbi:DUF2336 domain-containing protein [Temperatibacter marinus]|uniref:DUF2336 domain-containing protein n=1 Tax=Temperatibacter marinus TaxID=1456591 RepID=A0AA52EDG4_9PROT|nr:DUF2336 domain-containing protein [Temperatibacter marinus]WND01663.1 DUF2336 domain-containing protein [Temperatibacter marinus]